MSDDDPVHHDVARIEKPKRALATLLSLVYQEPWRVALKDKAISLRFREWAIEADAAGIEDEAAKLHRIADHYITRYLDFLGDKASVLVRMMLSDPRMPADSRMLEGDIDPANAANLAIRAVQLLTSEQATASEAASVARQSDEAIAKRLLGVIAENAADDILQKAGAIISSDATVDDKLRELSEIMPILRRATSRALADLLGVSHKAVQKTLWWRRNRRGEGSLKATDREARMKERGRVYEEQWSSGDDDD